MYSSMYSPEINNVPEERCYIYLLFFFYVAKLKEFKLPYFATAHTFCASRDGLRTVFTNSKVITILAQL